MVIKLLFHQRESATRWSHVWRRVENGSYNALSSLNDLDLRSCMRLLLHRMESMDRLGYYYNMSEHQRQTYISNYLDGGVDRSETYGKAKATMNDIYPCEQTQEQNMQIKLAANSNRHQFLRTVPEYSTATYPRHDFPYSETGRVYATEPAPQSCMYSNSRGLYEHYINHARSQVHWIRDLSQGRTLLIYIIAYDLLLKAD